MKFLSSGEKIRTLRNQLSLTQEDLQSEKITKGLISMIEADRRDITYDMASKLSEKFNKKADELNTILNIDEDYLMRTPNEDAELYCLNKLKNDDITEASIREVFKLAEEFDLLRVKAETYIKIGQIFSKKRNFEEACAGYDQAIKIYKSMQRNEKLAAIYLKMGLCKTKDFKYDTAIVYYNLSQYYSFVYDDVKTQKLCLYGLANCYRYLNRIDLALETIEKYLIVANVDDYYYNHAYNIQANCYESKGDYDKAIDIYKTLLEKSLDKDNVFISYVYNNLGLNYCYKNDFSESIKYFEMAEEIISKIDKSLLSHTLIEKSIVLLKQNIFVDAIKSVELGLKYAKQYNDIEYLIKGNYILADIYGNLKNIDKLVNVYIEMADLLIEHENKKDLNIIYNKLALIYLKQDKTALCEKYLLLSENLLK